MANPIPTLASAPPPVAIWELIPITRPWLSISGPAEFPGLIAASVWIAWSIVKPFGPVISRWRAETMPEVILRSKPNGLPMATTASPICTPFESPSGERVDLHLARVDAQDGQVVRVVLADHLGGRRAALTAEPDGHALGPVDYVRVGEDVAPSIQQVPRARPHLLGGPGRGLGRSRRTSG
jgi:hypothetical protein